MSLVFGKRETLIFFAFFFQGGSDKTHRGVVPNKAKAEEFATRQFNAAKKEQNASDNAKSSSIFRRRRDKAVRHRRSKSLGKVGLLFFLRSFI